MMSPLTRALSLGLAAFVVLALLALPAPPAPAQAPIVWKMGTATGPDSPINLAAAILDKTLQEKSKGRMKVELHLGNSLAKGEGAHLEGAQLGTIDIVPVGSAPIGGMFEPSYQALDLPFLWSSREQVWKVMDGPLGQELLKKMEAKGVKAFCFGGGWGFRNMMSNKRPIFTPDDMKGQTIRVQESPTYISLMKALGANPVPMPYVEVYLAMKQGTIDGMELPSFTVTADKFQEVTKYYSLTRHSYPPIGWFASMKKYQALPPDLQKAVDESMKAACDANRRIEVEREKSDFDIMKKAGTQINEVKDIKQFQALMKPVYDSVEGKVGKEFMTKLNSAITAAGK
jgi:tripartite ATP-independent transporter DctP family solute receptor